MVSELEHLNEDLARFRQMRHRLLEAGSQIDDDAALEALRGIISLHDAIRAAARSALEDEAAASRLRGRLDEIEVRLRRLERRAEGKREIALRAMEEAGLDHLDAPGLRIDVRHAPPAVVINDECLVPAAYRVERPAWLDYQAIRDALKSGTRVPGATFANSKVTLAIRTK